MKTLAERLNFDPAVTEADVLKFLQDIHTEMDGQPVTVMPIEDFWHAGNLQSFRDLQQWWPRFEPFDKRKPFLSIYARSIIGHMGNQPISFMQHMHNEWTWACDMLKAGKHNLENPNETKDERRRRLGREAVARHRKTASKLDADPEGEKVKQLHAAYIKACQDRKAAAAAHDEIVDAAKLAWEQARASVVNA